MGFSVQGSKQGKEYIFLKKKSIPHSRSANGKKVRWEQNRKFGMGRVNWKQNVSKTTLRGKLSVVTFQEQDWKSVESVDWHPNYEAPDNGTNPRCEGEKRKRNAEVLKHPSFVFFWNHNLW